MSSYLAACLGRDGIPNVDRFDFRYFIVETKVCSAFFQEAVDVIGHIKNHINSFLKECAADFGLHDEDRGDQSLQGILSGSC